MSRLAASILLKPDSNLTTCRKIVPHPATRAGVSQFLRHCLSEGVHPRFTPIHCAKFVLNRAETDQNQSKQLERIEFRKALILFYKARNQTKDQRFSKSPIKHLITQRSSVQIRPPQPTLRSSLSTTYSSFDTGLGTRARGRLC